MSLFPHSMKPCFCREREESLAVAGIHREHLDFYFYACFSLSHTAILHALFKKSQIHEPDIAQIFSIFALAFHL